MMIAIAGMAVTMALFPQFHELYPWFFINNVIFSTCFSYVMETPLLPDYVDKNSIGLANSYGEIMRHASLILGSSVFLEISKYVTNITTLFYIWTVILGLTIILVYFTTKDVVKDTLKESKIEV